MKDVVAIIYNHHDGDLRCTYVAADSEAARVAGIVTNNYDRSDDFFELGFEKSLEWEEGEGGNWAIPLDSRVVAIYFIGVAW